MTAYDGERALCAIDRQPSGGELCVWTRDGVGWAGSGDRGKFTAPALRAYAEYLRAEEAEREACPGIDVEIDRLAASAYDLPEMVNFRALSRWAWADENKRAAWTCIVQNIAAVAIAAERERIVDALREALKDDRPAVDIAMLASSNAYVLGKVRALVEKLAAEEARRE